MFYRFWCFLFRFKIQVNIPGTINNIPEQPQINEAIEIITSELEPELNEDFLSKTIKKYSLHIGLNRVDPNAYGGWDGKLNGCINDALVFKTLCETKGYITFLLIDEKATYANIVKTINLIISKVRSKDRVIITYSGHGGQEQDKSGEEIDKLDETLCFFDGQIVDDTMQSLFSLFPENVDVVFISDSCHSQTNLREVSDPKKEVLIKSKPTWVNGRVFKVRNINIKCNLIALTGCKDSEYSYDLRNNGNFTKSMYTVLVNHKNLSWKKLLDKTQKIAYSIRTPQTPQLTIYTKDISNQKAFL